MVHLKGHHPKECPKIYTEVFVWCCMKVKLFCTELLFLILKS